jgi:hypothetical protein
MCDLHNPSQPTASIPTRATDSICTLHGQEAQPPVSEANLTPIPTGKRAA